PQHLRASVEAHDPWQELGSAAALPLESPTVAQIAPRRFSRRWFDGGALAASVAVFGLRPSLLGHGLGRAHSVAPAREPTRVHG
ncbi:iron dicitrate transport regulator FecR, partial [Pseudomonas aeruginosa]